MNPIKLNQNWEISVNLYFNIYVFIIHIYIHRKLHIETYMCHIHTQTYSYIHRIKCIHIHKYTYT